MKTFEVNYKCKESYPPFSDSNNSVYVNAETGEEAINIAMNKCGIRRSDICFCESIKTIN